MAEQEDDVRPRSFWSGTITFGLVSIPVELYPANRSQRVSLRMVSPEGTPLQRRYFCSKDGRELDWDDIVRGYEVAPDEYVVVTDEELEKLAPDRTRDIDLRRFVPVADLDPIHFQRAYYLTPGGNSTKAYRLLAATMEQTGRAGIATFVMRGKEYLVAILAENGILRAETLRFADEVRTAEDVGLPEPSKPKAAAVKKVEKAITSLTEKELDEAELADDGAERLLSLVAVREASGVGVVEAPADAEAASSEGVIDLMEVLRRSLQGRGDAEDAPADGRKTARKAAKKAGSGSKSTGKSSAKGGSRAGAKTAKPAAKTSKKPPKKSAKKGGAARSKSARKSA